MDGEQALDRLELEKDLLFNDQVEAVSAINPEPFVLERECALPHEPQSAK
jgi:hypothetical protein